MQLSQLIYDLAAMIHAGGVPLTAAQASRLDELMEMPAYFRKRRLDEFEDILKRDVNDGTPLGELILELEELALCNLYAAFDPQRTLEYYHLIRNRFADLGFPFPYVDAIEDW